MIFEEMLKEERAAGFAKGRAEGVAEGRAKELQRGEFLRVRIRYSYFCRILERFLKYFRIKLKNKVIWMY